MIAEPPVETSVAVREAAYAAELTLVQDRLGSDYWAKIDRIEDDLAKMPQVEMPLRHLFTPGLYIREILLPKGTLLTTRIHLTEHPFFISAGAVSVWDDENGWVLLQAPHTGITKPGTRRILWVHEDTIWSTVHTRSDDETDPDEIVMRMTYTGGKYCQLGAAAKNPNERLLR